MSVITINTAPAFPASHKAGRSAVSDSESLFAKLIEDLKAQATQTPIERAKEIVLKKHDLSPEQYDQLPASTRSLIDKEIAEAAKKIADIMAQSKKSDATGIRFV